MNLLFQAEWLLLAVIALLAHVFFNLSIIVFYILIGVWIIVSLVVTLVVGWAAKCPGTQVVKENKNPYSAKTEDYLKMQDKKEIE